MSTIEPDVYTDALLLPRDFGGQEHILGEVIASLHPCKSVWVPFVEQGETLIRRLRKLDSYVSQVPFTAFYRGLLRAPLCEGVYFGTPTIVDDKALFPVPGQTWDKAKEREAVRAIVSACERLGYRKIVSGLGSGDISVEERIEDMGGGNVVAIKHFTGFTDWVIVREVQ